MKDCGARAECDAFGVFKEAVAARAAELLRNTSTKIGNHKKKSKRKKRISYMCADK